jgi:hypothetical protein
MKAVLFTRLAIVAVTAIGLYVAAVTATPRDCLTPEQVVTASANSWQGVSLSCNEAIRQARLDARQPRLADTH